MAPELDWPGDEIPMINNPFYFHFILFHHEDSSRPRYFLSAVGIMNPTIKADTRKMTTGKKSRRETRARLKPDV